MKTLVALLLTMFLANMVFSTLAHAAPCPLEGSAAEGDLLLTQGPDFVETGKAEKCLRAIIQREMRTSNWANEKELVSVLMDAAWKAEAAEIDMNNQ